jgi:Bacterial TSP3 repeat
MKFQSTKSRFAFAFLAGLALPLMSLSAAVVPNPASGDLFLGFRASGGTGGSDAYIVKLGKDTDVVFTTSGNITSVGNVGTDLVAKYGAGWKTRDDLYWGIFGVRGLTGIPTLYASRERNPVATPATAWAPLVYSERTSAGNRINSVLNGIGGYRLSTATANSTVGTFQSNSGQEASYNFEVATAGTSDFGSLSQWQSIEGSFISGTSGTALDVFKLTGDGDVGKNPTTLFGTFTINDSGVIHFTLPTVAPVDTDGDGFLDSEEAVAGTSPTNPADFFKVQSVVYGPSATTVTFNSIAARTYKIYYSQDLSAGSWTLIATLSSGPYTDTDAVRRARPKGFYKVIVSNP